MILFCDERLVFTSSTSKKQEEKMATKNLLSEKHLYFNLQTGQLIERYMEREVQG